MMSSDVPGLHVEHVRSWPVGEIVALYKAGGWWKDSYDPQGVPELIKGSFDFVVAYFEGEGKAVGMGRMISDGVSDAYIQDFVVLPEHRNKGIGALMVKELLGTAKENGIGWVGLIAEEGSEDFYSDLGFGPFKGTPMLYRSGD